MVTRWVGIGIFVALASTARAEELRVSAEPPLSAERLGDALRSYLDGVTVTLAAHAPGEDATVSPGLAPGQVAVSLRGYRAGNEDAEVVVVDGEETILARLPGALRTEDLYRAAALKVQALLQRRAAPGAAARPAEILTQPLAPGSRAERDRLWLDVGVAWMLPSAGLAREGMRLGAGLGLARRWAVGLGVYLEPPQSSHPQDIDVSAWELPFWLSLGFAWHQGRWQGWLDAVGHLAVRRISAEADGIAAGSDTAVSPRAGGVLRFQIPLGAGLRAEARLALLGALVDTRYRVDGQLVWPAARALGLVELGLEYGGR